MRFIAGKLAGVILIEPDAYRDNRGFFLESFHRRKYEEGGITVEFVQDNHSYTKANGLRGLHYQLNPGQEKLVRVTAGKVFDVVVDIRRGSSTFGQWESYELSAENFRQLYIPIGFAHGFCVLSDYAEFEYKCGHYYSKADERGIIWNDPDLAVAWPISDPELSERDKALPLFRDQKDLL